jgi:hypothetical protein
MLYDIACRHVPNILLLVAWWASAPALAPNASVFRQSLVDVVLGGFVKTEVFAWLGRREAIMVTARALLCALLVVKLSAFERRRWQPPWMPLALQGANIAWVWAETLLPLVRDLYSLAHAPPEDGAAAAEADAVVEASRRRERQRRAAEAAASKAAAAAQAQALAAPLPTAVPSLVDLAIRSLAGALADGSCGFGDCAAADELRDVLQLPIPAHLCEPLFEQLRVRGLLDDRTLPFVLAPDAALLRLSAGAGSCELGLGAAIVALPAARSPRPRRQPAVSNLTDHGIGMVAARCASHVCALHLTDCTGLSDNGVRMLAVGCAGLRSLELRRCPTITSAALLEVAQLLPLLEALLVGGCPLVEDAGVGAVVSRCALLRSLDVSGCAVRDEAIYHIAECARTLSDLNIAGCIYVSSDAIRQLAVARSSLRSLTLSRSFGCSSYFTDSLAHEAPNLELLIEPAQVPPSLRWHPLPFTEFNVGGF